MKDYIFLNKNSGSTLKLKPNFNIHTRLYELDTLRATAIVLVLFFHLDVPGLGFGYLGVDLFFVLSGYLMTRTVSHERMDKGRMSASHFLLKRFWRLAPSLSIVLLFTIVGAWVLFSPEHLTEVGMQVTHAAILFSNLLFFDQAGYFEPANDIRPLLHTWSLSVEEQFYLIFAVVIVLSRFVRLGIWLMILFFCGLAIWLALWTQGIGLWSGFVHVDDSDTALFYLMPFRLFQFMAGSMMALWHLRDDDVRHARIEGFYAAIIPLFAIGLLVFCLVPAVGMLSTPLATFSGLLLLLPNIYTAKLGQCSAVQFLAKISYQLYLVHWPLIVFWHYVTFKDLGVVAQVTLLVLSASLGWGLWRLTHPLTRRAFIHPSSKAENIRCWLVSLSILSTAAIAFAIGTWAIQSKGAPWRIPETRFALSANDWRTRESAYCGTSHLVGERELGNTLGDPLVTCEANGELPRKIFTLGDSHARHLVPGLVQHFPEYQIAAMYFTSCHAQSGLSGYRYDYEGRNTLAKACLERNATAMRFFADHPPTNIIIHQYDGYHSDRSTIFYNSAQALLDQLTAYGHHVVWLGPVVRPAKLLADCAAVPAVYSNAFLAWRCQGDAAVAQSIRDHATYLADRFGDAFIDTQDFFCNDEVQARCRVIGSDGKIMFRDKHHLSVTGSVQFIGAFKDRLGITTE